VNRPQRLDLGATLVRVGDFIGVSAATDVAAGKLVLD
jgi:hypothetical protein